MNKTGIEYLTHTWNPLAMRCTRVSPACDHCWHLAMAHRMAKNPKLSQEVRDTMAGKTGPVLLKSRLDEPRRRKIPSAIGVQFMGDLFHKDVSYKWIISIFHTMINLAPQHRYLILTKRPRRMLEYLLTTRWLDRGNLEAKVENIDFGVTAENQKQADRRIAELLKLKIHYPWLTLFVSIEPMLGDINIMRYLDPGALTHEEAPFKSGLGWVICGGETGPGARPVHPAWVRSIRDQCIAADTPFFFKGWGEWRQARSWSSRGHRKGVAGAADIEGIGDVPVKWKNHAYVDGDLFFRIGRKLAGNMLDRETWQQFPEAKDGRPN